MQLKSNGKAPQVKQNIILCVKRATEAGKQSSPTIPEHLIRIQPQRVVKNIPIP